MAEVKSNGRNGMSLNGSLKTISLIMGVLVACVSVFGFVQAIGQDRESIRQLQEYVAQDQEWVLRHREYAHITPEAEQRIEDRLDELARLYASLDTEMKLLRADLERHRINSE